MSKFTIPALHKNKELRPWVESYCAITEFNRNEGATVEAAATQHWFDNYDAFDTGTRPLGEAYDLPDYWKYVSACFVQHSIFTASKALGWLNQYTGPKEKILVLGDGISGVSWFVASHLPGSQVFSDVMGSDLMKRKSEALLATVEHRNATRIDSFDGVQPDVVLAFEVFEHFKRPADYADSIPHGNILIQKSPFGVAVHGHYREYQFGGLTVPNKKTGRHFYKHLRTKLGYSLEYAFFNGEPTVWRR